jgi:arylsulfatase
MSDHDKLQREILPIPDIPHVGLTTYDAKDPDTKYPPIEMLRPPKGAPNVLVVLIDDVGLAHRVPSAALSTRLWQKHWQKWIEV